MRMQLPIQSYRHRSAPASSSRLVNCFIETLPPDAKSQAVLVRSPGIDSLASTGGGEITGMHAAIGDLYAVSGSDLYKVDSSNVATLIGSVGTSSVSSIDMDSNIDTVVVINTPNAYYYDGTTFGQITDADFTARGASDVEFCDGWLLFIEPNTGRFFGADLATATSFDSLNFATAEGSPDNLVGMKVDHRQVLLLGSTSGEIWENTGISGFPFERAINGFFEIGCLNGRTIQKLDNTILWLASDYTVRRLDGATPIRVSTHAVEQWLGSVDISTGNAFTYAHEGHLCYALIFETGAMIYDATTNEWHDKETYGFETWNVRTHAQVFNREYVGSSINDSIGALNSETYTEFGATQVIEWTYQPVYVEGKWIFHDHLKVIIETGVGLPTGQGSDPQLMLAYSDDGGITWTNATYRSIGQMGEYTYQVEWHRLGRARQRVYRMSVSDPVKIAVTDTILDVRVGSH